MQNCLGKVGRSVDLTVWKMVHTSAGSHSDTQLVRAASSAVWCGRDGDSPASLYIYIYTWRFISAGWKGRKWQTFWFAAATNFRALDVAWTPYCAVGKERARSLTSGVLCLSCEYWQYVDIDMRVVVSYAAEKVCEWVCAHYSWEIALTLATSACGGWRDGKQERLQYVTHESTKDRFQTWRWRQHVQILVLMHCHAVE
jgi:hypothetical protein